MKLVLGIALRPDQQAQVKRMYVHRSTGDLCYDSNYPLQFANDTDWLAHTLFWVRRDGELSTRAKHCESSPTWPNNPELRK